MGSRGTQQDRFKLPTASWSSEVLSGTHAPPACPIDCPLPRPPHPHGAALALPTSFLLGLVSSQVSLSCTFPQLFPPSLISGSFLSLFSHLSFYFVFRENARNVLTWPTGTELHMESSPHGKESANPDRRPQDLCEETAQDRPSFRCSRGKGPKAGNTALSWHCQEARVVGLESPNREKEQWPQGSGGGTPGPSAKKGQESGSLHSPALPHQTQIRAGPARENGAPVANCPSAGSRGDPGRRGRGSTRELIMAVLVSQQAVKQDRINWHFRTQT